MRGRGRPSALALLVAGVALLRGPEASAIECTFVAVTGPSFGAYDVFAVTPNDSTGSITYRCSSVGLFDTVTIGLGPGGAGAQGERRMAAGASRLRYELYLDALRTLVWGDGTLGTSQYGPTTPPEGTNVTVPIHGRMPARQSVAAGVHVDTVVVTINY